MSDVIVIGAGGGGPVVAKELAARGLDVLMLEAGPWFRDPENEWSRYEHDANDPLTGYFRYGPGDRSKPAWFRETPQNSFLWQLAGVGGTTQHYYGNCPRAASSLATTGPPPPAPITITSRIYLAPLRFRFGRFLRRLRCAGAPVAAPGAAIPPADPSPPAPLCGAAPGRLGSVSVEVRPSK